jgi:hypothetical protein
VYTGNSGYFGGRINTLTSETIQDLEKLRIQASQRLPQFVQLSSGCMYFETGQVGNLQGFLE